VCEVMSLFSIHKKAIARPHIRMSMLSQIT
jgi:hypothetical protein